MRLEKYGPDPKPVLPTIPSIECNGNGVSSLTNGTLNSDEWKSQLVMLLKPNGRQGHWPIPEAFCIDTSV